MTRQQAFGRRTVAELLETGLEVYEIFLAAGGHGQTFSDLKSVAERKRIRIVPVNRAEIERMAPGMNHQGVVAYYCGPLILEVEDLLDLITHQEPHPILLIDSVQDPRNLGAIIRSAEVLGGGGVIIKKHGASGLTPLVIKASAGAALRLPIASASNIDRVIREMKDRGYWVYGLDADGEKQLWDMSLTGLIGFVVGGEGKGISQLVRKRCDMLVRIPQVGKVASLNVSVSASIALGEWLRQNT